METRRTSLLLLVVIYLGFVSLGLPDGTLGVAWPAMYPELGLPLGAAGLITAVVTVLSGISGFASGRIIARFRTGPVVLASGALTGGALLAAGQAQGLPGLLLAAVPLGLGAGAVDAGLNGFIARHYEGRHMNWLHACWGVGAACGPLVMGAAVAAGGAGWRAGYGWLGCAQLALAALFLATLRVWARVPELPAAEWSGVVDPSRPTTPANSAAGWLSPALFALYAGVEATLGLWAASILILSRDASPEVAAGGAAGYYGAITLGRVAIGFGVDRWGNRRVVRVGVRVAGAGLLLFCLAASPAWAVAGIVIAGLGLAPIYPGLMHEVPRRFAPVAVQTIIGRQSGAAYLGVAVLPAAAGWLAQQNLASVPWAVGAGAVALLLGVRQLDALT